jgi:hypothetical protein
MGTPASYTHVEGSRLIIMDNPACNAYCLSSAEDHALHEAAEWARQTLPCLHPTYKPH